MVSDDFLDMSKSLNGGAVQVPFFTDWDTQAYTLSGFFDNDKKLSKFTKAEMELLLHGKDKKFKAAFGGRNHQPHLRRHHRQDRTLVRAEGHQDAQRAHAESGDAVPETAGVSVVQRRAPQRRPRSPAGSAGTTSPICRRWKSASW